jgi:pyruvate,water dikinase
MSQAIEWKPPLPGYWVCDQSHMPRGTTPITQHVMSRTMRAGTRRMLRELGSPLDAIDMQFVNGQAYTRLRPLIRPDKPSASLPPVPLLKLAVRLHPEMRRRAARAEGVIAEAPWLGVIEQWHGGMKDSIVARNLELQDVDLTTLDDAAVLAQLRQCLDHLMSTTELHFWLHGYDLGPIGRYLLAGKEWGVAVPELLSLLEGASPSTSAPAEELVEIRRAVEASGAQVATLDDVRALGPHIAERLDAYLRRRGGVLFSRYDLDGVTLAERPDLVLAAIMSAESRDTGDEVAARIADVRGRIDAQHHAAFDESLAHARLAMDLRDDNGPTTAEWPLGLMRRALLELGARMVALGNAASPAQALELTVDELEVALSPGAVRPDDLAARSAQRARLKLIEPPAALGTPEPTPPAEVMPAAMRDLTEMVQLVVANLGMGDAAHGSGLHGTGIGTGVVRAVARVATSPEEALDRLADGEILVVAGTTPAYNLVLTVAGGLVTAAGGPMCHAAVIARELGIPAVIGASAALTDITDGDVVELDAGLGEVRIVSRV